MNKGTLFIFSFIVLLGAGVVLSAFLQDRTQESVPPLGTSIPFTIEAEGEEYKGELEPGGTVYEAMVRAKETSGFEFEGVEFPGLGFFVQEVSGKRQDPRAGKYWIYYVNGRKPEVGISTYAVEHNDIISWKYENEE